MGKTEETPEAQVNRTKVGGLLEAGVSAAYLEHLTCAHHHSGGLLRVPSSASINLLSPLYPHTLLPPLPVAIKCLFCVD